MTAIAQPTQTYTIAEFFALPDDGLQHELVKGELQTMSLAGIDHTRISSRLYGRLWNHVEQNALGEVYAGDAGFIIDPIARTVCAPDVAFLATARIPQSVQGFFPLPPDLAVEIISPNDRYSEVDDKVEEYQQAGVRLIWVVNLRRKLVSIYRGPNPIPQIVDITGRLDGENIVPGFALTVAEVCG